MREIPTLVGAAVLVVLAGTATVLDTVLPEPQSSAEPVETAIEATSGAWYCAVGSTAPGNGIRVVAAAPGGGGGSGDVRIDTFSEGSTTRGPEREVFASSAFVSPVPAGFDTVGMVARWWRTPVAVTRVWDHHTAGEPNGTVVGPCETEPSAHWTVPGVSTAGGAEAHLVLANPFDTDASVTVTLATPEGPLEPQLLQNVVVPKGSVRDVVLNDHAPERPDLGVRVAVRSGRVVAEGYQTVSPAVGGVESVTLAQAASAASTTWTVPWFEDRPDDVSSWLWVTNVGDAPAALTLTLHTASGGAVPDDVQDFTVPAGHVGRIDLAGMLPSQPGQGGVTVRSDNGQPIVVSAATRDATPGRTGLSLQLGAPTPDDVWVLAAGPNAGRAHRLELANPGAEAAEVGIDVWGPQGMTSPEALQGVAVPPGGAVTVDVDGHLDETDHHALFVTAGSGSVVASYRMFDDEGHLDLAVAEGVPGSRWDRTAHVPPVQFAPGLAEQVGTRLLPTPPADEEGEEPESVEDIEGTESPTDTASP